MKTLTAKLLTAASCLTLLVARPVVAQDDAPARVIPDKEAKALVKEFKKQIKTSKNLKGRLDAVQKLSRHHHPLLVKPLLSVAKRDRAKTIRQEAIKAIGRQPKKRARPALSTLLKNTSIMKDPPQAAALVRAIGNNCYHSRDWDTFKKMFNQSLAANKCADAQRAILEAAGKNKEIEAVKFLIQHIDEPAPAWVDDPSNPPASHWEARYKNWQKWNTQVTEALYEITGQRFGTSKEARTWMKKNFSQLKRDHAKAKAKSKSKSKSKKKKRR